MLQNARFRVKFFGSECSELCDRIESFHQRIDVAFWAETISSIGFCLMESQRTFNADEWNRHRIPAIQQHSVVSVRKGASNCTRSESMMTSDLMELSMANRRGFALRRFHPLDLNTIPLYLLQNGSEQPSPSILGCFLRSTFRDIRRTTHRDRRWSSSTTKGTWSPSTSKPHPKGMLVERIGWERE